MLAWMAKDFAQRGIESARLDAEVLAAHALGITRVGLYLDLDRPLVPAELDAMRALVVRRRTREPVAYIVGAKEHYGRPFLVTRDVLVPRPETELLIERSLVRLPERTDGVAPRVLDLCTGSGIVAIGIAKEREDARVDATDVSPAALGVARQNAAKHGVVERVAFHEVDLWPLDGARWDVVVANPPYIARDETAELAPELAHEPELALFADEKGLAVIRRIVVGARDRLTPAGVLLIEIGRGQGEAVRAMCMEHGFGSAELQKDLAGIERVVEAALNPSPQSS